MRPSVLLFSLLVCGSALAIPPRSQGSNCSDEENSCPKGTTCTRSTGIVGRNPHPIISCVRRCAPRSHHPCPEGEECVSVSDGPGYICMVTHRKKKPTGAAPASATSPSHDATDPGKPPAPDGAAVPGTPAGGTPATAAGATPAPPVGGSPTTPPPPPSGKIPDSRQK